jgi:hypothetical protein
VRFAPWREFICFFSRRGAVCAEENNEKLSLRSLRLGEKNKYYNFMMNLDSAALHPGYLVECRRNLFTAKAAPAEILLL